MVDSGPWPGVDVYLVAQRNEHVEDRAHDPRVVASGQVRAADRLAEERVARKERLRPLVEEGDVARRMSRRAEHAEDGLSEADLLFAVQVAFYGGHGTDLHAEDRAARGGVFEQECVLDERANGIP